MTHDLLILILLVVVVLSGSALCSGVEAALLSVNPVRVVELAGRSKPVAGARRLAQLRQRLGRTLSVLVIANNGFNIFGSLMLGGYAAWLFEDMGISAVALPLFSIGHFAAPFPADDYEHHLSTLHRGREARPQSGKYAQMSLQ